MSNWPLSSEDVLGMPRLAAWPAGQSLASSDPPVFQVITTTEARSFPPPADQTCWGYITLNAEITLTCQHDPGLRALVDGGRARISVDSQWIWWALQRRHGSQAPQKMYGSDRIYPLADHCVAHDHKLMLLGATLQSNSDAEHALLTRCPGLETGGFPPRRFRPDTGEEAASHDESLAAVGEFGAEYFVIGLSPDKQYRLAAHRATRLDGVTHGVLCFRGAIGMVAERVRRAPLGWQRSVMESVYRILEQPSRLQRLGRLLPIVPRVLLGRF